MTPPLEGGNFRIAEENGSMASSELQAVIEQLRTNPLDPNAPVDELRAAFPESPALVDRFVNT
jgi:hypothetical protein